MTARSLDTADLGPIRIDPNDLRARAKVVGDAVVAATQNDDSDEVRRAGRIIARHASPVTLSQLGRMLK